MKDFISQEEWDGIPATNKPLTTDQYRVVEWTIEAATSKGWTVVPFADGPIEWTPNEDDEL